MKKMYGDHIRLLFADTGSLMYDIETPNLDEDIARYKDFFDLSNYPVHHLLRIGTNKKVVLKFESETAGNVYLFFKKRSFSNVYTFIAIRLFSRLCFQIYKI